MGPFVRKHLEKIMTGNGLILSTLVGIGLLTITVGSTNILSLLAAATSSLVTPPAVLYFTPYDDTTLQIGQTSKVDININTRIPINAIGITVKFPQDILEVVGVSKEKSFLDLWTEETAIKEDAGEVHFSGGTVKSGGLTGTSTALTLSIRAKKSGEATLSFENAEVFSSDGRGDPIESEDRSFTVHIPEEAPVPGATAGSGSAPERPLPRSADLNRDGSVNLIDLSILAIHILGTYDPLYDLDMDGTIGLSDLSILLSKMGRT